jgi:IS30 family transposase
VKASGIVGVLNTTKPKEALVTYQHLNRKERGKIAYWYNQSKGIREIAERLNRSPSTISRELHRNIDGDKYRADEAQRQYRRMWAKSCRPRLYLNETIRDYVMEKLMLAWSPEQIAGRIRLDFKRNKEIRVSFSSIYRWLNAGLLPRSVILEQNLRHHRKHKKPATKASRPDARSIATRGKNVLRRSRYGDWEADTISFGMFPNQTYLMNINERKTTYCGLIMLKNIKRDEVMKAFELNFTNTKLPLKTMTSDRGMEFNCHNEFEKTFEVPYYYTDRGKPYQKPTVENTNGLIRQFLPKGTKITEIPPDRIEEIMELLNNRPRKSLGYRTPKEALHLT